MVQKSIQAFKASQAEQLNKTLVDISKQLTLKYSTYVSCKSIALSPYEEITNRGIGTLASVLHTTPGLIYELSSAIEKYIDQIDDSNIELVRKQFLPILDIMQNKVVTAPSELDSPKLNLQSELLSMATVPSHKSLLKRNSRFILLQVTNLIFYRC